MDTLQILIVGSSNQVQVLQGALVSLNHQVTTVTGLNDGLEALLLQKFNAVVLTSSFLAEEVREFAAAVKTVENRSAGSARIPVFVLLPEGGTTEHVPYVHGLTLDSAHPEMLTQAIARLATAVGQTSALNYESETGDLPVLEVEQLKEQVAYDDELLVELIDLYCSERARQSREMRQALRDSDYDALSRLAHTIKGSLGSLHALAAKAEAQLLELAGRDHDAVACECVLSRLEAKLDELEQHLCDVKHAVHRT